MPAQRKSARRLQEAPPASEIVQLAGDADQVNFYREVFAGVDSDALDHGQGANLQDEIVMLRVAIRQVARLAFAQNLSMDGWLDALNSLSMASARLARLVKVERSLAQKEGDELEMVAQAVAEVKKEMGW